MQTNDANVLRAAWKKKGDPPCEHPRMEKEYDLGAQTGDRVCTTCGRLAGEEGGPKEKK